MTALAIGAMLSVVTVTACSGGAHSASGAGGRGGHGGARLAAKAPGDKLTRRASLKYEIRGRPFPLPIVSGTVAGQPVLMLVDTGANSHVIAGWFAKKLGLPMKKLGDIGTDHVGKAIATYRLDNLEMTIDEWGKLSSTTVLATEVPEVIEKLGIGAFISPQRLDEEGDAVALDLAKGEIRAAWWDETQSELANAAGGSTLVTSDQGRACEENDGPVKGLAFVVPSVVDSQKVQLLIDTGAQHSDVFSSSPAGQKLAPQSTSNKEPMYTASGKISARKLRNAKLTTGAYTITADIDLIGGAADGSCPRDGVLAMDVLKQCTVLFGRSKVFGRCHSKN